ncbi:MAG: TolC family protein [Pseudomonadota bacterium]
MKALLLKTDDLRGRHILMVLLAFFLSTAGIPALSANPSSGPEFTTEMTLDQAIGYALRHNPDLQSAIFETARREGAARTAKAALLPQVDVFADMSHTGHDHAYPPATAPQVVRFSDTIYMAGAELKVLVWDFQQTSSELAADRERIFSSQFLQDRQKQQVVYTVASLYLKALTYDDLMAAAQSTRKSLQALMSRTQALADAGRAVAADVLKISSRLAQIESDLATLEAGRRVTVNQFSAEMGFEGDLPPLVYALPENPGTVVSESVEAMIREAMTNRPDLISQQHEIRAALDQETAAHRSRWPRIELRAGVYEYGANDPISSAGPQGAGPDNTADDWAIGLRGTVPLFDAGKRAGQIASAAAQAQLAKTAERKLRLAIEKEVKSALAELESAEKRVEATRQSVIQADEVLRNERLKYEAGRSVINFVLDAEAALLTNQSLLRQAQRSVSIAGLILDLSLGRVHRESNL